MEKNRNTMEERESTKLVQKNITMKKNKELFV